MSLYHYINKPEYFNNLGSILKRFTTPKKGMGTVKTVWNELIEIDFAETIGTSIARYGLYDLAVSETLTRLLKKGDRYIDIGANIGYTTKLGAYLVGSTGEVTAFEPNPKLLNRLKNNIALSSNKNIITLHELALSNYKGEGELVLPKSFEYNEGVAYVSEGNSSSNANSIKIRLEMLDNIFNANVKIDVLKIDVEGHELKALQGAQNLLNNQSIHTILFEDHQQYPNSLTQYLESFGYSIFRIEKHLTRLNFSPPTAKANISSWEAPNFIATLHQKVINTLQPIKGYSIYKLA